MTTIELKVKPSPRGGDDGDGPFFYASENGHLTNAQAQIFGTELSRLIEEDVSTTAEAIVNVARDADSPLHAFFEWDDMRAGELWRQEQARSYARQIEIEVIGPDGEPGRVRAFHAVSVTLTTEQAEAAGELETLLENPSLFAARPGQKVYVPFGVIEKTPDFSEQVLRQMRKELLSLYRRYEKYRPLLGELQPVFRTIEATLFPSENGSEPVG